LVLLLIQNYPTSKEKQGKESCFTTKLIEAGHFFLLQAVIGYTILPSMVSVI